MATVSRSVQWRLEGNSHYTSVTEELAPVLKKSRYQKALTCYENAHSAGSCDEEISSAAKNTGLTCWKLAKLYVKTGEKWPVIKRYFQQALKYFSNAYMTGSKCDKTDDWKDGILASCRGCWEDAGEAAEVLPEVDLLDRIVTIRECIDYIPIVDMKADCFMEIVAEAIKYGRLIEEIRREHRVKEADVHMHTALAESVQSRETGDRLLKKALLDEETLNIDMIWEVIDWYKNAIIKVRDIDMKQEAIALSKIGIVYAKVFKIKFKAKEYLKKAIELAQSMAPLCFTNESWYKDCTEILAQYQQETVLHEQEKDRKEKEEALTKLKPEIDELDKHESDTVLDFLKFVYKRFPRKNPKHKLDIADDTDSLEFDKKYKLLQQAVIHFHPDRVKPEEGMEEKVRSEEITKRLTKRYETIKSQK